MDGYRAEVQATTSITLGDEDGEIDPASVAGGAHLAEPELDVLSSILKSFNDLYGNIEWLDEDRVRRLITEDIQARVAEDPAYRNAMMNSDRANAMVEHEKALERVMTAVMSDDMQLYRYFTDDEGFKRWMTETSFERTYLTPDESSAPKLKKLDGMIDQIELKLREVVAVALDGSLAEIPEHVKQNVEPRIVGVLTKHPGTDEAELRSLPRILEYFDLRELQDTITRKSLWPVFAERFGTKEQLVGRFGQLAELRNALRHTRTVEPTTRLDGEAAIHWFGTVLG